MTKDELMQKRAEIEAALYKAWRLGQVYSQQIDKDTFNPKKALKTQTLFEQLIVDILANLRK